MARPARRALALLAALCATLLLLELGVALLVRSGHLDAPRPLYGSSGYWRSHHPTFGVWHEPNAEMLHRSACFAASYRTNSLGARDRERAARSADFRVVVLGDSFLEGWGVDEAVRLPNRLETATGFEHLNFAMAHTGPYQHALIYRELARNFDHAAVLTSVVLTNDLFDLDLERSRLAGAYQYRYRPYLVGEPPDFEHLDLREPAPRRLLRRYSHAFNALLAVLEPPRLPGSKGGREPGERELQRLEAALRRLVAAAEGLPVAVLSIPGLRHLQRYAQSGYNPIGEHLAEASQRIGFTLVDLLPPMAARTRGWSGYFFSCDDHWNGFGHATAAEITLEALQGDFYSGGGG